MSNITGQKVIAKVRLLRDVSKKMVKLPMLVSKHFVLLSSIFGIKRDITVTNICMPIHYFTQDLNLGLPS